MELFFKKEIYIFFIQIKYYIFKNFRYSKPDSVYDLMFLNHYIFKNFRYSKPDSVYDLMFLNHL